MIGQIVKKQALILLRNPMQLLLLIGLPIILIVILGTALGGWMNGEPIELDMKVALIENEAEEEQVRRFIADVETSEIPEEAVDVIKENAFQVAPIHLLKNSVFGSKELASMIDLYEASPREREELLDDNSYAAVIEVPEKFTYDTLEEMMFQEDSNTALKVYQNDQQEIGANLVGNILHQFQEQLTLEAFLSERAIDHSVVQLDEQEIPGHSVVINQGNPVTSSDYYTIGMAVFNVLFMATAIAAISFQEKQTHVFDRVILANVSRWIYFVGVLMTGTIFALIQLLIVFGFAWIAFGVTWPNLLLFFTVTLSISLSVGGITVLLTAISYRFNSEVLTNFFSSIIVTLMAFLGGSFFPIGDSSKFIQVLGDLTPNGAGMSAYLTILRGDGIGEISNHILYIIIFSIISIAIGAFSYPKRGVSV